MPRHALWRDLHRVDVWELLTFPREWPDTSDGEDFSEIFDEIESDRSRSIVVRSRCALEQIADQLDSLFRRGRGMDEMRCEICKQAHPGLVGSQ